MEDMVVVSREESMSWSAATSCALNPSATRLGVTWRASWKSDGSESGA